MRWAIAALAALLAVLPGCVPEGENSVRTRLVRPVVVTVEGSVIDAVSRVPLAGMTVLLTRRALGADAGAAEVDAAVDTEPASTDADGRFSLAGVALDVERFEYAVRVRDPADPPRYRDADGGGVYAFRDQVVALPEIRMVRLENDHLTTVRGQVREAVRNGTGVGEALVTLAVRETGEVPFSARTDAEGRFTLPDVPVREYVLAIDARNARVGGEPRAFAPVERLVSIQREDEVEDPAVPGGVVVDLGVFFLVSSAENEDLRLILTWDTPVDLDGDLLLPDATCDVNHLGGAEVSLSPASLAVSPMGGFGASTCYWPAFLNGEPGDPQRTAVTRDRPVHVVEHPAEPLRHACAAPDGEPHRCIVASLDNDSPDGSQPEVLTFRKELFLRDYPRGLGYFYDYKINAAGDVIRHYPAGIAVYMVRDRAPDTLNGSGARVEVFQGNTRIAGYTMTEISLPEDIRTWTVLLVEIGFKRPDPQTADDVYFRVLPFNGLDERTEPGVFAWEDLRAAEGDTPVTSIVAAADVDGQLLLSGATTDRERPYGLWLSRADDTGRTHFERLHADAVPTTALLAENGRVLAARAGVVHDLQAPRRPDGTPVGADCADEVTLLVPGSAGLSRTVFAGTVNGLHRFDEERVRCPLVAQSLGRRRNDGRCAGYVCDGDAACVPWESRCDGRFDCAGGSDEAGCDGFAQRACDAGQFRCATGQCLESAWRCDFQPDCAGGEDEVGCNPEGCPGFICGGRCMLYSALCDGFVDCPGAADEQACAPACYGFACDEASYCAPWSQLCDGRADCRDGTDETLCATPPCTGRLCSDGACAAWGQLCDGTPDCLQGEDEAPDLCAGGAVCDGVRCNDEARTCVPRARVCDGTAQCEWSEDEQNCADPPCEGFRCGNRACLPRAFACDGRADCPQGEDEQGCDPPCAGFRCNENTCLPVERLCDGEPQCPEGEDEAQGCASGCDGLRCTDGRCVPQQWLCDRTTDCPGGEDEAICDTPCAGHLCRDGTCLESGRCDGNPECPDGSDEAVCEPGADPIPPAVAPPPGPPVPDPTPTGTITALTTVRGADQDVYLVAATKETGLWSKNTGRPDAVWQNATPATNSAAFSGPGIEVAAMTSYNRLLWIGGSFGVAVLGRDDTGTSQTWFDLRCLPGQVPERDDCFDPSAPPDVRALASYDGRLFIGTRTGIWIVRLGERASLKAMEHFPTTASVTGFTVSGGRLYVMTEGNGLYFVQIGGGRR